MSRVKVLKVIEGKKGCDGCVRRGVGPISECQISYDQQKRGGYYWMDLCLACQKGIERHFKDALTIGPDEWQDALCRLSTPTDAETTKPSRPAKPARAVR